LSEPEREKVLSARYLQERDALVEVCTLEFGNRTGWNLPQNPAEIHRLDRARPDGLLQAFAAADVPPPAWPNRPVPGTHAAAGLYQSASK